MTGFLHSESSEIFSGWESNLIFEKVGEVKRREIGCRCQLGQTNPSMKIGIHEFRDDPDPWVGDSAFGDGGLARAFSFWRFTTCSFAGFPYTHTRSPAREGGLGTQILTHQRA